MLLSIYLLVLCLTLLITSPCHLPFQNMRRVTGDKEPNIFLYNTKSYTIRSNFTVVTRSPTPPLYNLKYLIFRNFEKNKHDS